MIGFVAVPPSVELNVKVVGWVKPTGAQPDRHAVAARGLGGVGKVARPRKRLHRRADCAVVVVVAVRRKINVPVSGDGRTPADVGITGGAKTGEEDGRNDGQECTQDNGFRSVEMHGEMGWGTSKIASCPVMCFARLAACLPPSDRPVRADLGARYGKLQTR